MIDQYIDNRILKNNLLSLLQNRPFYYIKSSSIVEKIEYKGRRFYSKYSKINRTPDKSLLEKHLNGKLTFAIPLNRDDILIEYFGSEPKRFFYLLKKILVSYKLKREFVYWQDEGNELKIFLTFCDNSGDEVADEISSLLLNKISKEWKILPDKNLPESYNIFLLPRYTKL